MVKYHGTCDVYHKVSYFDHSSGEIVSTWQYDNPEQIDCNVAELSPDNVQELFSQTEYKYQKTIKLETDVSLDLSGRIGNIRLNIPVFPNMVWNIDNIQPRIDYRGKVVGYRIICRSTNV